MLDIKPRTPTWLISLQVIHRTNQNWVKVRLRIGISNYLLLLLMYQQGKHVLILFDGTSEMKQINMIISKIYKLHSAKFNTAQEQKLEKMMPLLLFLIWLNASWYKKQTWSTHNCISASQKDFMTWKLQRGQAFEQMLLTKKKNQPNLHSQINILSNIHCASNCYSMATKNWEVH